MLISFFLFYSYIMSFLIFFNLSHHFWSKSFFIHQNNSFFFNTFFCLPYSLSFTFASNLFFFELIVFTSLFSIQTYYLDFKNNDFNSFTYLDSVFLKFFIFFLIFKFIILIFFKQMYVTFKEQQNRIKFQISKFAHTEIY